MTCLIENTRNQHQWQQQNAFHLTLRPLRSIPLLFAFGQGGHRGQWHKNLNVVRYPKLAPSDLSQDLDGGTDPIPFADHGHGHHDECVASALQVPESESCPLFPRDLHSPSKREYLSRFRMTSRSKPPLASSEAKYGKVLQVLQVLPPSPTWTHQTILGQVRHEPS